MASWREIDRIRKDPDAMQASAASLIKYFSSELTDWENTFLDSISRKQYVEEFTTSQAEKLLQIRDGLEDVAEVGYQRLSIRILIADCRIGHLDLDEDDAEWIKALPIGTAKIKRKHIGRLLRCARRLNNIDDEDAA